MNKQEENEDWIIQVVKSYITNSPYKEKTYLPECDKTLGEILEKLEGKE